MRYLIAIIISIIFPRISLAQNSPLAKEIFTLMNEARTNPKDFLSKYEASIKAINPAYHKSLSKTPPLTAMLWDDGLEQMAMTVVENGALNPTYSGDNKYCGYSFGKGSGTIYEQALPYVCDLFTNVHDPDYRSIGIYVNKEHSGYAYQWAIACDRTKVSFAAPADIDSTKVDFSKLNTAAKVAYMKPDERRMLLELNFVRAYPKVYAKLVADQLHKQSVSPFGLEHDEYLAGVELIEELNTIEPMAVLQPAECVYNAAKLHGLDCQKRGFFDHTGSDKSDPWDRILKQCNELKMGNENGAGGYESNPRAHVINLLIDSGISTRGHRHNILDRNWKYGACFRYDDPKYRNFWVQNFGY